MSYWTEEGISFSDQSEYLGDINFSKTTKRVFLSYFRTRQGRAEGIQEGMEKGMELKSRAFVINLITQLQLSDEAAAGVAEVPLEYVQQIRKELQDQL